MKRSVWIVEYDYRRNGTGWTPLLGGGAFCDCSQANRYIRRQSDRGYFKYRATRYAPTKARAGG